MMFMLIEQMPVAGVVMSCPYMSCGHFYSYFEVRAPGLFFLRLLDFYLRVCEHLKTQVHSAPIRYK